mgnify:FL=1
MRCTKCGCELPENSKFCFACGAKLEENCVEAQKKELAENLEQEDCQANEGDEEETVLLGAEIRGSYSEPEEEEHKYCPYCGCENDADAVFCCGCGKNMEMDESGVGENAGGSHSLGRNSGGKISSGKIIGVAAAAVVVIGGAALLVNAFRDDAHTKIAYLKDGKVMQTDLEKYKKDPMEYSGSYGDEDEIYGMRVTYSKDGKYICYPTDVKAEDGMTEFDLNFQKVGKEGGAIEIDDSVTKYKLLDNNKIVYLKARNDTLYISDRKGKKEKIASDVARFKLDKEQKNIVWIEQNNGKSALYQQDINLKKEKKKLSKSAENCIIGDDLKQIVVQEDDKLYLIENFGEREKIASDVGWVVSNNEKDKALYYVKMDEKKINAMDIVEDDTNGDEDMEWFLEELEEHSIEVAENSLYCYKDGKEVEIAKKLSSDIYAQDNSDTVLFTRFKMEELPKVRASKLDEIYDVDQKYYEALQESAETCIYNGKEIVTLDADLKERMGEQRFLVDDEKNIGYTMKVERNKDGEIKESQLLSFKTGKKADGKCSVVAEDVDVMMGAKDGDIYYLTDMDEGMGDLYCNEELIDSDVMIGTLEFTKEQKYPIYKTDYNTSKNLFTLKMFDGKNAKVIADDAFDYKVVDEKKIAVLVDYDDDDSTGTLKLYRGKDKLIELDDDVICLFGGMYN